MTKPRRFPIDPPPYPQSNLTTMNDVYQLISDTREWGLSRLYIFDVEAFKEKVASVRENMPPMPAPDILASVPIQVLENGLEMIRRLRDEHDKLIRMWETSWETASGDINEDFFGNYIQLIEATSDIVRRSFLTRTEVNAQGLSARRSAHELFTKLLKGPAALFGFDPSGADNDDSDD